MNILSLFDGISCGRVALQRAGINVNRYYSSEIKPYAIKVANDNFPQDTIYRLGDVKKIDEKSLPKIDLLLGGSPCQDLSGANRKVLGLKGEKSGLFFEYLRILNEVKPKYFLLENVKMSKENQDIISSYLGVEPININSSLFSPQLRNRLYWTNIKVDLEIKDREVSLNSILEYGYSNRVKARVLLASDSRPLTTPIKMMHRYTNSGFTTLIFKDEESYNTLKKHFDANFKGHSAKDINKWIEKNGVDELEIYNGVRYLTINEKEVCQTLPKGYTKAVTDKQAMELLGDGWTVDVIAYILSFCK